MPTPCGKCHSGGVGPFLTPAIELWMPLLADGSSQGSTGGTRAYLRWRHTTMPVGHLTGTCKPMSLLWVQSALAPTALGRRSFMEAVVVTKRRSIRASEMRIPAKQVHETTCACLDI